MPPPFPSLPSQPPAHIFVVDDDPEITHFISGLLTREGYRVQVANDPAESLSRELAIKPDLLLVDIRMPKISGLDLVRSLRSAKDEAGMRIVIVSALGGEEDIERGLESGADDYIVKPFNPADLILRVRRQIEILREAKRGRPAKEVRMGIRIGKEVPASRNPIAVPPSPRVLPAEAKILIIDDDPDIQDAVAACLKAKGHRIFSVDSGEKGLEVASRELPDLIVLDIMMPGMNGYEVSRELAVSPYTSHIPIMMLTARDGPEESIQALTGFADDFVVKPFNPRELVARAEALLRRTMRRARTKRNLLWLVERFAERAQQRGFRIYSPHLPKNPKFPGQWEGPLPDLIVQRGNKVVAYLVEDVSSLSDEKSIERWRLVESGGADQVILLGQSKETARLAKQIKKEYGFGAKIKWTVPQVEKRSLRPIVLPYHYVMGAGLILLGFLVWMILTGNVPSIWHEKGGLDRSLRRAYEEYRPRDVERQLKGLKEQRDELERKISPGQGPPKF